MTRQEKAERKKILDAARVFINDSYAYTGLISESLSIGTGADKLSSFDDFSFRSIHPVAARRIYANSDILQNIVDIPPLDATREGFTLTSPRDDDGASEIMQERLEELKILDCLRKHAQNVRMYTRGSIFYPVIREHNSEQSIAEALSINMIERIEGINVFEEDDFEFYINTTNPLQPNYYDHEKAFIQGQAIHPSRYKWNAYKFFPRENDGVSMLQKVMLACLALRVTNWSLATVMIEVQNKVLKIENFDEYARQEDTDPDFRTSTGSRQEGVIGAVKRWMTSAKMVVLNKSDEYERQMYSATGVAEATQFFWEFLSAVSGMPQSAVKGQAQGTISTADTDARRYAERVRTEIQIQMMQPTLRWVIKLIKNEKQGKFYQKFGINGNDIKFDIDFNQIWNPDAKEEAQIKLINSQRGIADIKAGIRDPDQVRAELYPELQDEPLPEIPEKVNGEDFTIPKTELQNFLTQ